jgi:hypothetical protein
MPGYRSTAHLITVYRKMRELSPEVRVTFDRWEDLTFTCAEYRQWFRDCLNDKINRGDVRATWRKMDRDYTRNLIRDRRIIEDYLYRRYRSTGCHGLLNTKELQRRYPQINCQEGG